MRMLVTGGAGFIGSNLVEELLKQGHFVRVIDNFSTGKGANLDFDEKLDNNLEICQDTITSYAACLAVTGKIDYVFHLAALASVPRSIDEPSETNDVNVTGTLNILEACKYNSVKRVVFSSSSSIYGNQKGVVRKENMVPNPLSPYALQKYTAERYCTLYSQLYGLQTISLRYFNIFGPKQNPDGMYATVIPAFIKSFLVGDKCFIHGDGEQTRDFTYVSNVVSANLLAIEKRKTSGEVVNIGCGTNISLNELYSLLATIFNSKEPSLYDEARPGEARHTLADLRMAKKILGYKPRVTFEDGILKTAAFFSRIYKWDLEQIKNSL